MEYNIGATILFLVTNGACSIVYEALEKLARALPYGRS